MEDTSGTEEMTAFEKILRGMLRYRPEERIVAEEVLRLLPACEGRDLQCKSFMKYHIRTK